MPVGIPAYQTLAIPVFEVLKQLGASATIRDIDNAVIKKMNFSDDMINEPHSLGSNKSELSYRLVWSRTLLKKKGIINNPKRGIWTINDAFINLDESEIQKIIRG